MVSEGTPVYSCFPGPYPKKDPGFIMDVVDAFTIKNRGIVLTGTVELGTIDLEDVVNYRGWDLLVKGIESFHRPVKAGDNIGILIGDLGGRSVEPGEKMYLIRRNNNG